MDTIAEIVKDMNNDWLVKFSWGELNFTTEKITVNQRTSIIKMWSDIRDIMDNPEMMTFAMPCFIVGMEHPQLILNDKWQYADKKSADNVQQIR